MIAKSGSRRKNIELKNFQMKLKYQLKLIYNLSFKILGIEYLWVSSRLIQFHSIRIAFQTIAAKASCKINTRLGYQHEFMPFDFRLFRIVRERRINLLKMAERKY